MKSIEKLLPKANAVLQSSDLINTETKKIKNDVFDGYISGFGPSVIMSGLLPTLSTYAAKNERIIVLNAIAEIAAIDNATSSDTLITKCITNYSNKTQLNIWKEKLINASVALKLMIRTYQLK
ncbi:MAG TPA: hypothetical protein PLE56_12435 [Chitinophagales bacterium]|nr:hypothetical protein [Chitinophagales bacterium]